MQNVRRKKWKKYVKKRDRDICRRCGFNKNIHIHHILPKKEYHKVGSKTPLNGITLCGNCHSLLKEKETQTDLRGFLPCDMKIDNQLKSLLKWVERRGLNIPDHIKINLAGDEKKYKDLVALNLERAKELVELKKYKESIAYYDVAIQNKSNCFEAYFGRGRAKAGLGDYAAAIPDYDKSLCIKPDSVIAYYYRSGSRRYIQDYNGAIADCNMVIKLSTNSASGYYLRGLIKYDMGKYEAAILDYNKSIKHEPTKAVFYWNRGVAKLKIEQYEKAIEDFQNAICDLEMETTATHHKLIADGYIGTGDFFAAIMCLDDAIELKDNDPTLYTKRAELYEILREYDYAIGDYDTAIHLNPNDADTYLARGLLKYSTEDGRYEGDAFEDFETAFTINPKLRNVDRMDISILNAYMQWKDNFRIAV